ncbi:Single-stranded-DNA-specific exonuclease RecJ [Rhodovastum atsumiense]|uniref:Single-stranded-DNA-specific exonuclease RecJ n=1 Tax=Rhodovastum atsumiense TaxID=504468 RepID=A0A5M6IJM4_9PROT|nr:single-stranded-DNA-specific exonuclease RecJ [Rhodovastum atsumiense]KAA5608461.1 single-stranded-DNA-specific exonuclease RecJ [Rhodovastum atsumiense]CAH2599652.1 Single-stranded-DNA-specific exonuclease RecJ [Rhodovastum atsumiense]
MTETAGGVAPVLGVTRSLTNRRWVWRQGEDRVGLGIAQRLGVPEVVGRLLAARGVGLEAAATFLEPTLRALLPDPSVLRDMDAAVARLAAAVCRGETVGVFGDYDVDGACSGALMVTFLRSLGCTVMPYVPDRMTEGYGPNVPALQGLAGRGATLLVCVDCGTAAGETLASLQGQADVIVLDHHKSEVLPAGVVATVNPNRVDCGSGLGTLCAAAIAFLTAVGTVRELRRGGFFAQRPEPDLLSLLDIVALATVCDVMPLTGLNRALVTQGLKVMARRARPGIAALLEVAQVKDRPSAATLGFALGPRINAAGRISESDLGLRLLLCEDPVEARTLAATLDAVNRQRQVVEASMLDAAMAAAEAQIAAGHATLLVSGQEWHPGVVGIVAGRIKERFNRPACVAALADGMAKGSGRSVAGLDLGAAVIAARQSGILVTGGGHAMAAGFSLPEDRLAAFHALLDERLAAAATLPSAADLPVEGAVAVPGCTTELARHLGRLAPFGNGNEEPVLILPRVRVMRADRVGREGNTIRAFVEGEGGGGRLRTVLFRAREGALADALLSRGGEPLHIAGHLRAEEWNGMVNAGFVITDAASVVP